MQTTEKLQGFATVEEVSAFLRVSRAKVYQMVESGSLPHVRIGHSVRVPYKALEKLVASAVSR